MKRAIKVDGVGALLADLRRVADVGEEAVANIVNEVGEKAAREAKTAISPGSGPSAPGSSPRSKSGRLERSIRSIFKDGTAPSAIVGTSMFHGRLLEFGTVNMEPRPWLMPAIERAREGVAKSLKAEFEARL